MIYLDNAATSFPKPPQVSNAVNQSLLKFSANPGRGGHKYSMKASEEIFKCRQNIADFFNAPTVENVIFTQNCTMSLNTIIKGILNEGDHVVVSNCEHNSVMRPLKRIGVDFTQACYYEDSDETVDSFRKAINSNTRLIICTQASNVFGFKFPIERISALCKQYGVLFCVDAAQSAGVFDIDVCNSGIDFLACPGHKGLYGPMGTGFFIINSSTLPRPLIEGGTGSSSNHFEQPQTLPDKYESGTLNLNGICGLNEGVNFVKKRSIRTIHEYEIRLLQLLYDNIIENNSIKLYTKRPDFENFAPVLSLNIKEKTSEETAQILNEKYGIAVRAGLHCAITAHESMNTDDIGTVRFSPSVFNKKEEILFTARALNEISKK